MSQYIIPLSNMTEAMVGWDQPMGTFFAQVYTVDDAGERVETTEGGEDATLLWVGADKGIRAVDELDQALRPYGSIPQAVRNQLWADAD